MTTTTADLDPPKISERPLYLLWLWQGAFWVFFSIVSFVTLTLWYKQFGLVYIGHIVLQATIGMMLSFGLYWAFMRIWNKPITVRLATSVVLVIAIALLWTLIRMEFFVLLTGEPEVWKDFGGWFFGSIFIFMCWAAMFYGIRYYQLLQWEHIIMLKAEAATRDEQLKRMQAQSVARDAQIKMLRYQLNPHFMCNALNAINALVEAEQGETAQKMTVNLSRFLRYSLDNNPDTKVALENEVAVLNLYLDIERVRFGDRLSLDFHIDEPARRALVPSLLLQPIIENSMKHAIAQNEQGGTIGLNASVKYKKLVLELSDTGGGGKISKSKIKSSQGRGVGMRNTGQRLEALYHKNYQLNHNLMPSGGLKTTIVIPFETAESAVQEPS